MMRDLGCDGGVRGEKSHPFNRAFGSPRRSGCGPIPGQSLQLFVGVLPRDV